MSFVVLAMSGLLFNVLLARLYGPEAVGIFNQVYAVYIILSMIASFGIQLSSLHYVSIYVHEIDTLRQIITSAVVIAAGISLIVGIISWLATPLLIWMLSSADVGKAYLWILPGVVFFALNKVLLNAINGLSRIRALAIFQSLRFVLLILLLGIIIYVGGPITATPGCLTGAEIIVFLIISFYLRHFLRPLKYAEFQRWGKRHILFGLKSVFGGVVTEANTRVDILMLGIFMSDRAVGIYSIAALVVEGLAKLVDMLRFPINPYLAREIALGQIDSLCRLIRRWVLISYGFIAFICVIALTTYDLLPRFIIQNPDFHESWVPFVILTVGLVIGGGYRPFNFLLSQAGYPGAQTGLNIAVMSSNIVMNFILISLFGINGVASATAITYILNAVYLKLMVRRILNKWI